MSEENKTVDPFQEKAEAFLKKLDIDTDPRGQVVFAGPVLKETLAQFGATMYAQGVIDGNKLGSSTDKYSRTIEIYRALKELVELKALKDNRSVTEDYLKRKPLAWSTAKRVVKKYEGEARYWGARAGSETVEDPNQVIQCRTCYGRGWVGIHDYSGQTQEMCAECKGKGYV